MITDWSGSLRQKEIFYPYGQFWAYGGDVWSFRFAGLRENLPNAEPGTFMSQTRDHHSRLYRWMTPDPLAGNILNPQSLNRYGYVMNNPTNLTDPLGLYIFNCAYLKYDSSIAECLGLPLDPWTPNPGPYLSQPPFPGGGVFPDGGGGGGTGNGGAAKDVSKTWSDTFPCSESATDLMAAFKSNMGQFADNPVGPLIADFPSTPIKMGGNYDIYSGVFTFTDAGPVYFNRLNVTVTSQTSNSWTFTTNPRQHYINGTVTFMASNAGNGNVHFVVAANGDFANRFSQAFSWIVKAGEDMTWNNLLKNVRRYCSSGGRK